MKKLKTRFKNMEKSEIRQIFDNAPKDSINFGLGELQFDTPKTLLKHASDIISNETIRYTPNAGMLELRRSVANYYAIPFKNNVCITVGAQEAIFASLFSFIESGDEVLIPDPSFIAYNSIVRMLDGIPVSFDLDPRNNFKLDKNSLTKKLTPKTKMLILNDPSNPLGTNLDKEDRAEIIEFCTKNKIILIVDEIYRELYLKRRSRSYIKEKCNVIVISGLSKSHCLSGWRIGWLTSQNEDLIKPIITAHQYICTCAPYLSQKVALKALSKDEFTDISDIRKKIVHNFKIVKGFMQDLNLKFHRPSSAPYLFLKTEIDDRGLAKKLLDNGLITMPGSIFGKNGKKWLRINYGVDEKTLKKGLNILSDTIKSLTR